MKHKRITPFVSHQNKENTIISSSIKNNIKSSGGAVGGTSNRRGYYRKKQRKKSVLSTVVPAPTNTVDPNPSERKGEDPIEELKGVPASGNIAEKGKSSRRNRRRRKKKSKNMEEEVSAKALNPTRFADLRRSETKSGDAKGDEVQVRGTMGTAAAAAAASSEENVRSWFHNLSKEDKAIAVSITDQKFIGMCMNEMGCFGGQKLGECLV